MVNVDDLEDGRHPDGRQHHSKRKALKLSHHPSPQGGRSIIALCFGDEKTCLNICFTSKVVVHRRFGDDPVLARSQRPLCASSGIRYTPVGMGLSKNIRLGLDAESEPFEAAVSCRRRGCVCQSSFAAPFLWTSIRSDRFKIGKCQYAAKDHMALPRVRQGVTDQSGKKVRRLMSAEATAQRMVREYGSSAKKECISRAEFHEMEGNAFEAIFWRKVADEVRVLEQPS